MKPSRIVLVGCTKTSYALSWNVQTVPERRITETPSFITTAQLQRIREQIALCVDVRVAPDS